MNLGSYRRATFALNASESSPLREVVAAGVYDLLVRVDGWTAASFSPQVSNDGVTWYTLFEGTAYVGYATANFAANRWQIIRGVPAWKYIRFFSHNASNVAVAQTTARVVDVIFIPRT